MAPGAKPRKLPTSGDVLDYYRNLRAEGSDYVGYSEASLKRAVLETVLPLPAQDVVEVGCGPNPVVPFALAEQGRTVTLVEISQDFCATAALNAERRGVSPARIVCAPAHATTLADESFDLAIMTEVLEHIPDALERETIVELGRILRPAGYLFISVPNEFGLLARYQRVRAGRFENEEHLREYTHPRLRALLEGAGFVVDRAVAIAATVEPFRATRAAWLIDRVATRRPEWGLKVAFLARRRSRETSG